jgi:hypothetical protein
MKAAASVLVPIVLGSILVANCRGVAIQRDATTTDGRRTAGDSAYLTQLAKWERDSFVLDSLTRLAHTDSLYRLYRRSLEPGGTTPALLEEVNCEYARLRRLVGAVPARRAFERMRDTVFADRGIHDSKDADRKFFGRAPDSAFVTDTRSCGVLGPPFPRFLDGTATTVEPTKPNPPRRP